MAKEATSPDLIYVGLVPRYTLILWSSCQPRSDEGHFCLLWLTIIEVMTLWSVWHPLTQGTRKTFFFNWS